MNRHFSPLTRLLMALPVVLLALAINSAEACGCGGYVAHQGDARVSQERALVRWQDNNEDIVMSFNVAGSSDEAALIMPVPSRATVKLADDKLFDSLETLTRPLVEKRARPISFGAGGAAPMSGAPPVTVLDRQTLGPFDVSTLAATDSKALGDWLTANGYNIRPQLADALQPYVAQGWYYVAVRLTPGQNTDSLKGTLDPIWVSFQSPDIVYPMRASAAAPFTMPIIVYVLAEHRVTKSMAFGTSHVSFAGWVQPNTPGVDAPLAPFVTQKMFLTKFEDTAVPSQITSDYVFTYMPSDDTYQDVQIEYVDDPNSGLRFLFLVLACTLGPLIGGVVLVGAILFLILRSRRKARAAAG